MIDTGGSETEKFHTEAMIEHGLHVRSNLTGVSNTRAVPVGKRVEGATKILVWQSMTSLTNFLSHYNYRRGTQSICVCIDKSVFKTH